MLFALNRARIKILAALSSPQSNVNVLAHLLVGVAMRLFLFFFCLFLSSFTFVQSCSAKDAEPPASSAAKPGAAERHGIDGFRSAKFGMAESDVRQAMVKDLGVKADAIHVTRHPSEQT